VTKLGHSAATNYDCVKQGFDSAQAELVPACNLFYLFIFFGCQVVHYFSRVSLARGLQETADCCLALTYIGYSSPGYSSVATTCKCKKYV
jgi:hypothetical protein